jgi:hypothetical protein
MSDKPKKIYGRTKTGLDITDELIEKYVAEAEAGFDLSKLRRVRGRPRMGAAPAKSFPVRLDPALRAALDERAAEGTNQQPKSCARPSAATWPPAERAVASPATRWRHATTRSDGIQPDPTRPPNWR